MITTSLRDRIQAEMVRALIEQAPAAVFAHLFFALIVAIFLWERIAITPLLGWLAVVLLVGLLRLTVTWAYRRTETATSDWRFWSALGGGTLVATGALWGLAALLFLDPQDPLNVSVLVAIIVGIFCASAASAASSKWVFYAFSSLSFLPMIGVLLHQDSDITVALTLLGGAAIVSVGFIHHHLNKELLQTLQLGFENEALRRAADEANAAKTRFLAAASHDLRQPIHAMNLSLGVLTERIRNPDLLAVMERVDSSVNAVDSMLTSLLDVSKLDAGVVEPKPCPIEVTSLLQRLAIEFQANALEGGNRLQVHASPRWVLADGDLLQRILRNLLSNALRYTTHGRVLLAARFRGPWVRFEVRDNGIGIPPTALTSVFDEFTQLGEHAHDRHQGLGLGLSIVKRLAALQGHALGVRSEPGVGSCFWIDVPQTAEPPKITARAPDEERQSHDRVKGARVLILDNDPLVLQSLGELLRSWGCELTAVSSLPEAEAALATAHPALLIVDYRLADTATGLQSIQRLRLLAGRPIPALLVTGDTAPERLREARNSRLPLLHKPVKPARLRSAMQHLLKGAQGAADSANEFH